MTTCPHCHKPVNVFLTDGTPPSAEKDFIVVSAEELNALNTDVLDDKSREFVYDLREKAEKYKGNARVYGKAIAWFSKIRKLA